ncbi:MAG: hypothetical protein J6S14_12235 [Clostridia bacterium]|nr:hypothetical protein [Clostridia bacterium]
MPNKQPRINVVMHPWRVVFVLDGSFEPQKIKYTIMAESWNKAFLTASDEALKIADLIGAEPGKVKIESVMRVTPSSE